MAKLHDRVKANVNVAYRNREDANRLADALTDAVGRIEKYEQWSSTQVNRELLGLWHAALAAHERK